MENKEANDTDTGRQMYNLLSELFPICRSITGNGVRQTLDILKKHIPLVSHEVKTGTMAFDWVVPREWNIRNAFIEDDRGNKIVDFKENNLHVVGYSTPVDRRVTLQELQEHLYSLEDQPDAIPYATSYYKEQWGFCIAHNERAKLKDGTYHVFIDSDLKEGHLSYGELIIPGKSEKEVFLSTYICHPSMANNELSGPVVATYVAKWLLSQPRNYTYRIILIPETIGSIVYLSKNLDVMKRNMLAGFNISCVGDDLTYSFVSSRYGNTLADKVVSNILKFRYPAYTRYSFLERGSDERQYCSPGVDFPLVTICRSKFGKFREYHTSLDNLSFVSASGLNGSYEFLKECIELIENNRKYKVTCCCEPQMGKRGLYPNLSTKKSGVSIRAMMDFISYADGGNDIADISNIIGVPPWQLYPIAEKLKDAGLLAIND